MVLWKPASARCPMMRGTGAPVLLYHATYDQVPESLAEGLHNVRPSVLYDQLSSLKRFYRFVSVDELAASRSHRGLAAVTFDDGYLCVHEEAFPILLDLEIPVTIFVNGCTLGGKPLWRDKVRYVINHHLVEQFESFASRTRPIDGMPFYRYSKEIPNNSREVEQDLDAFLASMKPNSAVAAPENYCLANHDDFLCHRLVHYGNHSQDHYHLATLTPQEQADQIEQTQKALERVPGIQRSRAFSIPFGQPRHFNDQTLDLLTEMGYDSALLSRNRLNLSTTRRGPLTLIERFMPDERSMGEIFPQVLQRSAA